jgi:hypothetical protein
MTQVAGTTDTFDSAVLKESLDSVMWDLFPTDTYFQNTIDKTDVKNTQHQWVFDTLAAAANNKQVQGDDVTYATLATAVRVSNYTQIARKPILLSDTYAEGVDVVGKNPMGRAVMKAMKEYKRDVEFDLLGRQGSSAGASATASASGGVCAWIWGITAVAGSEGNTVLPTTAGTNGNTTFTTPAYAAAAVIGQTDGTTAASTVTLVDITAAAELAWIDGGEPDVIIASSSQKKYIDAMTSLATRTADIGATDKLTIQGSANIIVTSFGTFKVVLSRYLNRTTTLVMQMDKWAMGQLRAPKVKDMAKTGDASKKLIVGEYTLVARNPNSSAKLVGFAP